MNVRVRYAPSPTGLQHIGGLRTALFNYLFAKAMGGKFYLRIEDTDQTRYEPEAEKDLYDTLRWAGLEWDEGPDKGGPFGPYVQSQRLDLYQKYAAQLVETGHAYRCYCTSERLDAMRAHQDANKLPSGYDGRCSHLSPEEQKTAAAELAATGKDPVIRFRMPRTGQTLVKDMLLGDVVTPNTDLPPDPVLLKSDGFPTYHLAHAVDDHFMETSHVLRAREWLPSAPLHVLLFQALGWEAPVYCHMPLILGADGQKLSKRHGATSVRQFKEDGYLPEALVNYLALLGWSYDDSREFFTKAELEKVFNLDRLNKAPAVFDYKKLEHFNTTYLRQKSDVELAALILPELQKAGLLAEKPSADESARLTALVPLIRERIKFPKEAPEAGRFAFQAPTAWPLEDIVPKKSTAAAARETLENLKGLLTDLDTAADEALEHRIRAWTEEKGLKLGDVMMPLRVALCGGRVSPPLIPSLKLVGKTEAFARIHRAVDFLKTQN